MKTIVWFWLHTIWISASDMSRTRGNSRKYQVQARRKLRSCYMSQYLCDFDLSTIIFMCNRCTYSSYSRHFKTPLLPPIATGYRCLQLERAVVWFCLPTQISNPPARWEKRGAEAGAEIGPGRSNSQLQSTRQSKRKGTFRYVKINIRWCWVKLTNIRENHDAYKLFSLILFGIYSPPLAWKQSSVIHRVYTFKFNLSKVGGQQQMLSAVCCNSEDLFLTRM